MSDSTEHSHAAAPAEAPFSAQEISGFAADDRQAGRAICTMLAWFFFYTVIVMGLSTYVTYKWVING